jgi:hypothetical protein
MQFYRLQLELDLNEEPSMYLISIKVAKSKNATAVVMIGLDRPPRAT